MSDIHEPLTCPKKGASADELSDYLDKIIDPYSSRRIEYEDELLIAKAKVEGHQWLNKIKNSGAARDYRRVARIKDSGRTDIPTPTDNIMLEAVENETSRLCKRNSEVYVDPSDASPGAKAGAKLGTDVLMSHLEDIKWPRLRRRSTWRNIEYGTMILKSFLQRDNLDTVKVPAPGVAKCEGTPQPALDQVDPVSGMVVPGEPQPNVPCDFKLTSPELSPEHVQKLPPEQQAKLGVDNDFTMEGLPEDIAPKPKYSATECLECGGAMSPYTPVGQELDQTDAVGRPLGKDVPLGKAMIEACSPFSVYFENEGLGVEPDTFQEIAESTPRSLDWIKRYYTKNTELVKAEDPTEIAETHPLWGEYSANSKGAAGTSNRIYRNHCRVRERYQGPTMDYPKGRALVMAGRVVLMDDDLMVESEPGEDGETPEPIPRVKYAIARCFPKDGEIQGQGFPVMVDSDQNRINMTLSQIVDTRERHGVPGLMYTRGMNLVGAGWIKGYTGRGAVYDVDPLAPNREPTLLPTTLMDPGVWKELEYSLQRALQRLGANDIETGNAPPGLKAYSAIRYLGEKASERREQREKEIIEAYEEIFKHQLELMQRFYPESRKYTVKVGEEREEREFKGMQLQGQTRAKVRERPSFDLKTAEREALAENIALFPDIVASPYSRREAAKVLGLPDSVLDQTGVQLDDAEAKWLDFIRTGAIPVVDENLDNHAVFFDQYGRLLKSPEGKDIAKSVGWDEVIKRTQGWKDVLFPPPIMPPMPPPSMDPEAPPPLPPQPIPQQGPAPTGVPLQDQIGFVWGLMLSQGAPPQPPPQPMMPGELPQPVAPQMYPPMQPSPPLQAFLAFRAVFEAHHLLAESQMGGQMPAPGTPGAPPGGPPSGGNPGALAPLPPLSPNTEGM